MANRNDGTNPNYLPLKFDQIPIAPPDATDAAYFERRIRELSADLANTHIILRGTLQRGGEQLAEIEALRARVAELETDLNRAHEALNGRDRLRDRVAEVEMRRYREALKQIGRWQEGSVGTMRQDDTTINYAKAALKG